MTAAGVTFDRVLPIVADVLARHAAVLPTQGLLVNRDLYGRVRLLADAGFEDDEAIAARLRAVAVDLERALGAHGVPAAAGVLFEPDLEAAQAQATVFALPGSTVPIAVTDRLAVETDWGDIGTPSRVPRVVFYSVKGGVGRSTALAATAWALAGQGERVLVVDLDLESPGLSTAMVPADRRPAYGLVDWLVEDLVDNGDAVARDMVARSGLHAANDVLVAPAHGADPGAYVAKLGRVWVPKVDPTGRRTPWARRFTTLLDHLERESDATVVLVDARSGLDEIAALSLGGLGAGLLLMFASDGEPIWNAYRMLFDHWRTVGAAETVRDRLKVVASLVPDDDPAGYLAAVREHAWDTFRDTLYDEVPGTEPTARTAPELFSFDVSDDGAPHAPWMVRRASSFDALHTLHGRLQVVDPVQVDATFGPLIDGVRAFLHDAHGVPT